MSVECGGCDGERQMTGDGQLGELALIKDGRGCHVT